ncbi:allantoate amidohydrolase [Methylobacterium sp. J-090]|uniref:allantoate amidohydrolase n=1 Tax=Methylobacterium sp. J-090 TaxID=2836666 RepID=UPI001FBA05EC|nr:allantoate amidohydrolase [Methylobacterium sp. J-090]MCJ2084284.1 allantoate amidohydrolase [Methylobacterium sp. J-090]
MSERPVIDTLQTALAPRIVARLDALAAISADPGAITRVYLSPEQARASALVLGWMREAGMTARIDAVGNVIGRLEGPVAGEPAVVIGSHLDTVRDAGRFDGPLGVVAGIECVAALVRTGVVLPFAIEVVGFADEEGTRFATTLIGSRALAGTLTPDVLDRSDADEITMGQALLSGGFDPNRIGEAARAPGTIRAYLELHIEQGPALERAGLAVGLVTAISGATRLAVTLTGEAGHAGTVAMAGRRDALAGAAECILAVEARCAPEPGLVGTVGTILAAPGAVNVIPGRVGFSLDLRAPDDRQRRIALADLAAAFADIAARRGLELERVVTHDAACAPCDPTLMAHLAAGIAAEGHPVLRLPSGAGHDGMAIAAIAPIAMLFVRCRGGISHHPDEFASGPDIEAGARVLLATLLRLAAEGT